MRGGIAGSPGSSSLTCRVPALIPTGTVFGFEMADTEASAPTTTKPAEEEEPTTKDAGEGRCPVRTGERGEGVLKAWRMRRDM